jgi:hypothetical protein
MVIPIRLPCCHPTLSMFDLDLQLLMMVRTGGGHQPMLEALAHLQEEELWQKLRDENDRRAFWINIYNAFALLALRDAPDLKHPLKRFLHFKAKRWVVAGRKLSLDNMEHGLLRGSRLWWAMGRLKDPFPGRFERRFRVPLDARIHFALNCGAASCPPIAFYEGSRLNEQLELATAGFLEQETVYDPSSNTLKANRLLLWYRHDFGGRNGVLKLLKRHGLLPQKADPLLVYRPYDWSVVR